MFQSPTLDAVDGYVEVETYKPFPRQQMFHASPAKYRLFGGAAGPGPDDAAIAGEGVGYQPRVRRPDRP